MSPSRNDPGPPWLGGTREEDLRALADFMRERGLSEVEVREGTADGGFRSVRLCASGGGGATGAGSHEAPLTTPPAAVSQSIGAHGPGAHGPGADGGGSELAGVVASPMVGTVYLAPEPGADSFVRVGSEVREGDTLLIIEAMKVMSPLPAPRAGRVARILVEDAQPVEYGQPLVVLA